MRIALLTDGIQPYVLGGMQRHSFFIAKYLALQGVFVDLYHCPGNTEQDIGALAVFTDEERPFIRSFVIDFPPPGKFPGHYLRRSYRYSELIYKRFLENSDVDFIYAKGFTGWKLLEAKKKGQSTSPVGVNFHGLNMFQKPPSFKGRMEQYLFRRSVRSIMSWADYVFSYGAKITDIIVKQGIRADKILELTTGIEPERIVQDIRKSGSERNLVFVGRYERLKGVEELCEAIAGLQKTFDFNFHFIGPIPERKRLDIPKVHYHGKLDQDALTTVLDKCDVLLCPSYSEGMPNVIIEAMARGLAIIATDVGAVSCMVSDENGWLLKSCTTSAIKQAMTEAITIDNNALEHRKAMSLEIVRNDLRWDQIATRLLEILNKIAL